MNPIDMEVDKGQGSCTFSARVKSAVKCRLEQRLKYMIFTVMESEENRELGSLRAGSEVASALRIIILPILCRLARRKSSVLMRT